MKPGLKLHQGHPAGRDPREMTQDELREAGHEPMSPLQAHRARCLDCCDQQVNEISLCSAVGCPAWPFRMGTDPWRKPASEARREAARRTMERINARRKTGGAETASGPPENGTAPCLAEGLRVGAISATGPVDRDPETDRHREGSGPAYRKSGRAVRPRPGDLADFVGSALRRETDWRQRQVGAPACDRRVGWPGA